MLKLTFGRLEAFFKGKVGKKRDAALEISSIGRFDSGRPVKVDTTKWHIDRLFFTQSNVTGAAVKMNVCGNPLGGLAISVSWSLDAVEEAMIEAFICKFKQKFQEVLGAEKQQWWVGLVFSPT